MGPMKSDHTNAVRWRKAQNASSPVILLVEDESFVREVTRQVLEHGGYKVLEAASPDEALRLAGGYRGHIDLLLTDMVMPGMNGAELAGELHRRLPGLATVCMSGYAESDVVRKMRMTSATHIQKPFTVEALLSRIDGALNPAASVDPDDSGNSEALPSLSA